MSVLQEEQATGDTTVDSVPATAPPEHVAGITAALGAQRLNDAAGQGTTPAEGTSMGLGATTNVLGGELRLRNRAAESKSPYVRSHSTNAVAWQLWDPETLALARQHDKLIFLSIGYAACHWCHVMSRESFTHPSIASLLNSHFIPIKLDREERPDIDRIYMNYLQAATGGGGWPLNVFLTPELEPLFGGTYWPGPGSATMSASATANGAGEGGEDGVAGDMVGLRDILEKMAGVWESQRSRCREEAGAVARELRGFSEEGQLGGSGASKVDGRNGGAASELQLDLLEEAYTHFTNRFDPEFGGFGAAPKFATPASLGFLLDLGRWTGSVRDVVGAEECDRAREMVLLTLQRMAEGGIKDQIGEGFARYSVTRDWRIPHFEKMLYDQALLLPLYTTASTLTRLPLYRATIHDLATYLTSAPLFRSGGGIHTSEDADSLSRPSDAESEKREGAYYIWTTSELRSVLGERDAEVLAAYYGASDGGNVEPQYDAHDELMGQNVLAISCGAPELASRFGLRVEEVEGVIATGKAKLRAFRERERPRPSLDDKIVAGWNGLAIGALARAGAVLSAEATEGSEERGTAEKYIQAAVQTAEFIRKELYSEESGVLKRVWRDGPGDVDGFAEDYAFLIQGLLELYSASFEERWLQWAEKLQETQIALFADASGTASTTTSTNEPEKTPTSSPTHHGFFSTPSQTHAPDTLLRLKSAIDDSEPSANSVSASNLFRLSSILDSDRYRQLAEQTVKAFEDEIVEHPFLFPGLLGSVVLAGTGRTAIVVMGPEGDAEVRDVLGKIQVGLRPGMTVVRVGGGVGYEWLAGRNELLKATNADRKVIMVCEGKTCREVEFKDVEGLLARN